MTQLDWLVLLLYLCGIAGVGAWVGRGQKDSQDFLLGARSIPWWAALMSLVATEISAATFLGAPEQGYIRDLTYLQFSIGTIAARFVLATFFIVVFYRAGVTTVYEFLKGRFGPGTHKVTAGLFLFGRLFADGSRLFIAAITIEVATGMSTLTSILILAAVTVLYTSFGGIKAVIWTDVAQAVVLVGSGLLVFGSLYHEIGLPFGQIVSELNTADKFNFFGNGSVLTDPYNWLTAIVGGFFLTMATHGTDHDMVQRLLTCKDDAGSQRSMWMSGFIGVGVTLVFISVGLLLFVFIQHLPAGDPLLLKSQELAEAGKNGHMLLYYALAKLPKGLLGLLVAGVLAAAMSSFSSALNAMTATFVNDFYPGEGTLTVSRVTTCVIGVLVAGFALLVAAYKAANPNLDLLSLALGVMTFFYGGLLGIFLVGLFSQTRGNDSTNALGAVVSTVVVFSVAHQELCAWPWFIVLGTAITVAISVVGRSGAGPLDEL